jgi:hypothetical protein
MPFEALVGGWVRVGPALTVEVPLDDAPCKPAHPFTPQGALPHGLPEPSHLGSPREASRSSSASPEVDSPSSEVAPEPAQALLRQAGLKLLRAREAGVDVARMTCLSKALGVAASAIGLGVAVALAVVSLGAAAPLVAIAGTRLLQAAADARDARQCLVNARRLRDGEAIPPGDERPLGANALGNLLHGVARRRGLGDIDAVRFATNASAFLSTGLSVVALGVGMVAPALPLSETICQWVNSGLVALLGVHDAALTHSDRGGLYEEEAAVAQAQEVFREIVAELSGKGSGEEAPGLAADVSHLQARAQLAFTQLLDDIAPLDGDAGGTDQRLRATLLGELDGWTLQQVPIESEELFGDPFRLAVVPRNRGAFGPDGGSSDSGGAIGNGLLTTVFTVFENLPLPVMQGLLTTARVAGALAR